MWLATTALLTLALQAEGKTAIIRGLDGKEFVNSVGRRARTVTRGNEGRDSSGGKLQYYTADQGG